MVHSDTVIKMLAANYWRKKKATNLPPSLQNGDPHSTFNKLHETNAEITCIQIPTQ